MIRRYGLAAAVALLLAGNAAAADLSIRAFYGKFQGGAVAQNEDSIYFGVTARDTDVEIAPADIGFKVTWTSVIRRGGDPSNPNVRRKTSMRTFRATERGGVWQAVESKNPIDGGELCWARINGNTLSVYLMVVGENGAYEVQKYDRTLTGSGMELVFTRIRDGDRVRTVKGRLIKVAN